MAAPKANKFALNNTGGRPPMYSSAQELLDKIAEFFTWCEGESVVDEETKDQVWVRAPEQPNITNLALYLGFESRQSFYDYAEKEEFSYIVKRARLVIESHYEDHLLTKAATGAIFALKNFGWEDKSKVEQTGANGGPIRHSINVSDMTDEELESFINGTNE